MNFVFTPARLPPEAQALRTEVRDFLAQELPRYTPVERAHSWSAFNAEFSRKLGARGWIGLTWPQIYGGGDRTPLERYVLVEELLAAGAPVAAHWIADRQSGALLLRYGTEAQRQAHLPAIARGEMFFCIGMSEPNAGSDLASIKTGATRTANGWRLNGQKLWTTNAQHAHRMIALARTSDAEQKHQGLSQFLIDLSLPGITIRPITDLVGDTHFNEVFFDDVELNEEALVGVEGDGWKQVTAELSLERSGPERYLSSYHLFTCLLDAVGRQPDPSMLILIGKLTADFWTLRNMSLSIAAQLADGKDPSLEASIVKDLGNSFEQELPRLVQAAVGEDIDLISGGAVNDVLAFLLQASPSFSLRGGTREILRGIIARGLGLR
jgi:Acyl-CoA dehydrogenase, N-terminal domain/Acyl-CoA dehydrogenase, middle domain